MTHGGRTSKGKRHQMPEPKSSCIVSKLPNFDVKFQKYLKTNRGDEIGPKNVMSGKKPASKLS